MTVYGYTITLSETVGHGSPWWEEYYETEECKSLETMNVQKLEKSSEANTITPQG